MKMTSATIEECVTCGSLNNSTTNDRDDEEEEDDHDHGVYDSFPNNGNSQSPSPIFDVHNQNNDGYNDGHIDNNNINLNTTASRTTQHITIDEAIDKLGYGRFQTRILVAVGLCSASDAMEIMLLSFLSMAVSVEWNLSSKQASSLIAIVFAGAFIGTLLLGRAGDVIGRKPTFVITASIVAIAGIISCFCQSFHQLLMARFCVGIGIGGVTVPFDTFSEFLPTNARGKLLSLPSYFWTVGTVLVAVVAHFSLGQDASQWRYLCFYCSLPCLAAVLVGAVVVPESPRWMLSTSSSSSTTSISSSTNQHQHSYDKLKSQQQQQILIILREAARINGKDPYTAFPPETIILPSLSSPDTATKTPATTTNTTQPLRILSKNSNGNRSSSYKYNDIGNRHDDNNNGNSSSSSGVMELFSPKRIRITLFICMVWFGYACMYYGTVLVVTLVFSSATSAATTDVAVDFDDDENHIINSSNEQIDFHFDYGAIIISTLAEATGATVVFLTVDRFGRKCLHSLSFAVGGMTILMLCIFAAAAAGGNDDGGTTTDLSSSSIRRWKDRREILILFSFLARMFVFVGSSITWIWTAELLCSELRTTGHALANAAGRVGGFFAPYIVVVSPRTSITTIGAIMASICGFIVTCSRFLPETHGLPMGNAVANNTIVSTGVPPDGCDIIGNDDDTNGIVGMGRPPRQQQQPNSMGKLYEDISRESYQHSGFEIDGDNSTHRIV